MPELSIVGDFSKTLLARTPVNCHAWSRLQAGIQSNAMFSVSVCQLKKSGQPLNSPRFPPFFGTKLPQRQQSAF
ncbi:MAG: hypothetical protein DWH78_10600 [Planctomycetota bacterium]|jgi:hypothetical protein|nr:MAG: hypothetical protein DWH78_10600 [Planctomycetota bacterium]